MRKRQGPARHYVAMAAAMTAALALGAPPATPGQAGAAVRRTFDTGPHAEVLISGIVGEVDVRVHDAHTVDVLVVGRGEAECSRILIGRDGVLVTVRPDRPPRDGCDAHDLVIAAVPRTANVRLERNEGVVTVGPVQGTLELRGFVGRARGIVPGPGELSAGPGLSIEVARRGGPVRVSDIDGVVRLLGERGYRGIIVTISNFYGSVTSAGLRVRMAVVADRTLQFGKGSGRLVSMNNVRGAVQLIGR